jgi:RNA recognition motif-containing protein
MDLLLWRLINGVPFCQFVVNVYVPKDRVTNLHQGYGFVEFRSEEDADYAIKILNMIKLYGKPIRVNKVSTSFIISSASFQYFSLVFLAKGARGSLELLNLLNFMTDG